MSIPKPQNANSGTELYDIVGLQNVFLSMKLLQNFVVSVCVKTNVRLDHELLLQAVNEEIKRNEGLRVRLKKVDGVWKQYIIDPFRLDSLECIDVSNGTLAEAEACVDKVSDRKMSLTKSEQPFQYVHFIGPDNQDFFLFSILHPYSDGYAASLVLRDTLNVYFHLSKVIENISPLSSVRSFLAEYPAEKKKREEDYEKAKAYYLDKYERLGEPLYLSAKKNGFTPKKRRAAPPVWKIYKKVSMLRASLSPALNQLCNDFCKTHGINQNSLFFTALSIYYFAMNSGRNDISYDVTLNMRGNHFTKQLPFQMVNSGKLRTVIDLNGTFLDGAKQTDGEYIAMLRNTAFGSAEQDQYCTEKYPKGNSLYRYCDMVFTRVPMDQDSLEGFRAEGYWPCPKKVMDFLPLYLLIMDSPDQGLILNYRYQVDVYKEQDMQNLHNGMIRILTRGMENPDLTVKELMEEFM